MRIQGIHINGYGLYHGFHVGQEDFAAPITVFYGPNEAGKSTLHSFIRSILFGFQVRGSGAYEPLRGGRLGGALTFLNEQGEQVRIERHAPPKKGMVQVYTDDGEIEGEAFLQQMLGHVSAPLFHNIFAFNHLELQRLETLHSAEISAYLYSAALGTGKVNLLQTGQQMKKRQDELFKPRASKPVLNQQLKELERKQEELEQIKRKLNQYAPLQEELAEQERQLSRLRGERLQVEQERKTIHQALEGLRLIQEKKEEVRQVQAEMEILQQHIDDHLDLIGSEWSTEKIKALDLTIQTQDAVLKLANQKQHVQETVQQLTEKRHEQLQRVHRLRSRMEQEVDNRGKYAKEQEEQLFPERKKVQAGKKRVFLSALGAVLIPGLLISADQMLGAVILFLCLAYVTFLQIQKQETERSVQDRYRRQYEQERSQWKQEAERQRQELHYELAEAEQLLQQIDEKKGQQEDELVEVQAAWEEWMMRMGFPEEISASALSTLLHTLEETKKSIKRMERLDIQKHLLEASIRDWQGKLQMMEADDSFSADEWRQRLEDVERQETAIVEQMEERATHIGQLKAEIRELESEQQLAAKQQEFEEKKQHFQTLAKEWSVHKLAEHLCTSVRQVYEEERQPSVLQEAGRWMERITGGRYTRVIAPLGRQDFLIINQQGDRLQTGQLSRGTVEQLYLSMRFALVQEYGQHIRLPIMMDDVFVNFDSQRLRQTLRAMEELSQTHQILFFTCHEHVLRQVQNITNDVHVITLGEETEEARLSEKSIRH